MKLKIAANKSHAATDIHNKSNPLGMLLTAKGKAVWLATSHIHSFAASDAVLKIVNIVTSGLPRRKH